ncbi:hypothetical protein BJF78_20365 [Pseudonocardia sp. CNS-139]|nr:hypothetical protein BJF78_20365 [Pseudonocardia sp. CNS-139]
MAVQVSQQLMRLVGETRYEPTPKRIRALVGGEVVVDSTGAVLVWEPRRVVPSYAVPVADVHGELVPAPDADTPGHPVRLGPGSPAVYDPSTGFGLHTAEGEALTLRTTGGEREGAAFRPSDPDLARYVVLDFGAFDTWLEEDEEVVSHPRDPFHRVDVRRSSRHVRIERDGHVLAESARPSLVFETALPVRTYLPPDDVRLDLLAPSPTRTACAYKGQASYRSFGLVPDVAWTYERPLPDAVELAGLVAFFDERVDVTVDGHKLDRPLTPWS